ncbi:MAG: hypothetical protein AAFV29_11930, partial [Myxococcota bacterium]
LNERYPDLVPNAVQGVRSARDKLDAQWDHLADLFRSQHDPIARTPRASHHLFTNLPDPRADLFKKVVDTLDASACDQRTVRMPPLAETEGHPHPPSLVVEHALGQLLFNPGYPTVVASCREHIIHWNAPTDACQQMVDRPAEFLASMGALDEVQTVVDRHRRASLLVRLARDMGQPAPPPPPRLSRVVSFQCLMVATEGAVDIKPPRRVQDHGAYVDGHRFSVRAMTVAPFGAEVRDQVQQYRQLAQLLAPGFAYGRLQSEQSLVESDAEAAAALQFATPSDLLTKLELMHEADIFLGHSWIDDRPDLLAVYPYHVHLKNFVEAFRRHYQHARSRL